MTAHPLTPLAPGMAATFAPPVMEARRWLAETPLPEGMALINVSQAAPVDPPPEALCEALAEAILTDPTVHLYGPVLGQPELRAVLAARTAAMYGGAVAADQVAITQGCNQAFAAVLATLAGAGDAVILPTPWYFNHKMWLDMAGVASQPLPTGPGLLPDPEAAAALIGPATRAIVLVTPNNPGGAEYPADLIAAFRDLARARGIALIIDETYRDFHSRPGAPHGLFADPDWDDTVISLYSFSKAYRLTGHRVGAVIASPARLAEVEKFLDTVAICPAQPGQRAALWGMAHLDQWLAGERDEILARRAAMEAGFAGLPGWRLLGCGAYFAYAEHPFAMPSDRLARHLLARAGILTLPGTMFTPRDDPSGGRALRIAFANIDRDGIAELFRRLADQTETAPTP
ncbi:MAG: aminotransferase [Alkalilacustris sp.]